jgi:membrane protein YdbS with pleckstrin-like domain
MLELARTFLLRLLRIPPCPHVPPGEEPHSTVFRAGEGYYNYLLLRWFLKQVGAIFGLLTSSFFLHAVLVLGRLPWGGKAKGITKVAKAVPWEAFLVIEIVAWSVFVLACAGTFLMLVWDFQCRYYILTDRCLRIQEGLWNFREQTFSLANIQDLDVRRGPLQRFLGIGDLVIRTAGGGGDEQSGIHGGSETHNLHQGRLRGVADPERIRDHLLKRMRAQAGAPQIGLGAPARGVPQANTELAAAARATLVEAQALRETLAKLPWPSSQQA